MTSRQPMSSSPAGVNPSLQPLEDFYGEVGRPLPLAEALPGESIPEPERSLLVHGNDMTSTLAAFHRDSIHLQVLRRARAGDIYVREVVLLLDGSDQAVEFGAIRIDLSLLPPDARGHILEERLPLGQILRDSQVAFLSRPKAFLKLVADDFIRGALRLSGSPVLFGRRNTLSTPGGAAIAEIIEILPPPAAGKVDAGAK